MIPPSDNDLARGIFFPRESLGGKSNYKIYFYIYPDGSIRQLVFLNVLDKRQREEVICFNFHQMMVRHIIKDTTGVRFVSRNEPWDFGIELSNGDEFNVEITSIADNELHFTVLSREEMRDRISYEDQISLRELRKLSNAFPDEKINDLIQEYLANGYIIDDMIVNPFSSKDKGIYLSRSMPPDVSIWEKIANAI